MHIFANTKMKVPFNLGSSRRASFFKLLRERKITPSAGWNNFKDNDFINFIIINQNGVFTTYYSKRGYDHGEYADYKEIELNDIKVGKILDIVRVAPHVDDYMPKTKRKKKVTNTKVDRSTKTKALQGGDLAIHDKSGAVILLSNFTSGTTSVKGTLLGSTKEETKAVGSVRQYELNTLTAFDGKVTLSNAKPRTRKKKES